MFELKDFLKSALLKPMEGKITLHKTTNLPYFLQFPHSQQMFFLPIRLMAAFVAPKETS